MLDYEWGNPSSIMLTGDVEPTTQDSDSNRPFFDHYSHTTFNDSLLHTTPNHFTPQQHHHFDTQNPTHFSNSLYDPRAYTGACASYPTNPSSSMLSLEPLGVSNPAPNGYMVVPKTEPAAGGVDFMSRIGLKLGGRTYFSSSDDDFLCRLYRRPRPLEAGLINAPRCQAEGCNADLTHAKHYHRRHKVCEYHSKASTVIAAGLTQRFCQQCSRFHLLTEFDNGKRSCRRRLADHNRRRRKSNQNQNQDQNMSHLSTTQNSSSENFPIRSPPDSGAQSSSSVTVAISPPRISLDCFRSYHATATSTTTTTSTSSASTSSLFHSNG